ncbi:hypothetical protein ASS64_16040 [Erythrobacter sp. AP23]|nr:hypothetical protein ASS64_16040 [Erythrobacter sp. AP23]
MTQTNRKTFPDALQVDRSSPAASCNTHSANERSVEGIFGQFFTAIPEHLEPQIGMEDFRDE